MRRSSVGRGACPRQGVAIFHNVNFLAYCKISFRRERCPQRSARAIGAKLRQHRIIPGTYLTCRIFRHIVQKYSAIHKVLPAFFEQSDENSDGAIYAPELCGVALNSTPKAYRFSSLFSFLSSLFTSRPAPSARSAPCLPLGEASNKERAAREDAGGKPPAHRRVPTMDFAAYRQSHCIHAER